MIANIRTILNANAFTATPLNFNLPVDILYFTSKIKAIETRFENYVGKKRLYL